MASMDDINKYLNYRQEEKKLDLTVKFDSKAQKVGVILFGIGLIMITLGICVLFFQKFNNTNPAPQDTVSSDGTILYNLNSKEDTQGLLITSDASLKINTIDKKSIIKFKLSTYNNFDELAIKVILSNNSQEEVVGIVLNDLIINKDYEVEETINKDLSGYTSWSIEVTTVDDLVKNYNYQVTNNDKETIDEVKDDVNDESSSVDDTSLDNDSN